MSSRSIQNVQSVSAAPALTAGAAVAVGALVALAAVGLVAAAREIYHRLVASENSSIQSASLCPVASLRSTATATEEQVTSLIPPRSLSTVQQIKLKTFAVLASSAYVVDPQAINGPLRDLEQASTVTAAKQARDNLLLAVEGSHNEVVMSSIATACSKAATVIGFSAVHFAPSGVGTKRVIAEDPAGRTIVTEISTDSVGNVLADSEVLGVADGTCVDILDRYEQELVSLGVSFTHPKKRRPTAGVAQSPLAMEHAGRRLEPRTAAPTSSDSDVRRRVSNKRVAGRQTRGAS